MRSFIILGAHRSGISAVASCFASTRAFMGKHLAPATADNPHGNYEDAEVTQLNNSIIAQVLRWPILEWKIRRRFAPAPHADPRAFWLAAPRRIGNITLAPPAIEQLRSLTGRRPFCFKDPRFSVTLPFWRPFLPRNCGFIVVFRDPASTVDSMLRDAAKSFDPPLAITRNWAYLHWHRSYSRLLQEFRGSTDCLFVHYDDVVNGSAWGALSGFAGVELDFSRVDARLSYARQDWTPANRMEEQCAPVFDLMSARTHEAMICGEGI